MNFKRDIFSNMLHNLLARPSCKMEILFIDKKAKHMDSIVKKPRR